MELFHSEFGFPDFCYSLSFTTILILKLNLYLRGFSTENSVRKFSLEAIVTDLRAPTVIKRNKATVH
jgi:hypothetical protein